MQFTQFTLPHGRRQTVTAEVSPEAETLADDLCLAGWQFEVELLRTGQVHGDCCNHVGQLDSFLCNNGPEVPDRVEQLVLSSHARWVQLGRPAAKDFAFDVDAGE